MTGINVIINIELVISVTVFLTITSFIRIDFKLRSKYIVNRLRIHTMRMNEEHFNFRMYRMVNYINMCWYVV